MKISELITNNDGRLSTTTSLQFFGGLLMAVMLIYAMYLDRPYVNDLFSTFALFCGGGAATKGAVAVLQSRKEQ